MAWADSSVRERSTTSWPVVAATSAMPDPMIPEPTTPMRSIPMLVLPETPETSASEDITER